MKIAFLLDTFPSLTETFIARDIAALRALGLPIEVFALRAGAGAHSFTCKMSPSLLLRSAWGKIINPALRPAYFKALGAAWWQQITESGEAQSFAHIHAGWASHPAYIAWGAAEKSGLNWSFSGHARDIFVEGGDLRGKLHAARFAAVCTKAAQQNLIALSPEQSHKIIYSPHGIDAAQIDFGDWQPKIVPHILAVGRLVEKKGFGVLLDACAILQAQKFPFTAQVIGDGPLRETLIARRDRLHLQRSVQISGASAQEEILPLMRAASCLAVPALTASDGDRDGLPNVILEAAACGLPVVATGAGAIEEFIDQTTGFLCASGQAESLARALIAVFSDAETTNQKRIAARNRVERDFDWMKNASHLADHLYENLKMYTVKSS